VRRGFKAWCENTVEEFRDALDIPLDQPFDPDALAAHLDVVVWRPEDVPELSVESLHQLTLHDPDSWSAVTLSVSGTHVTIVNSAHANTRQRSSLSHELAHLILDHAPGRIDISPAGHLLLNSFEKEQEEEADWLSAALLVPREGLRQQYRSTQDVASLANHFDVSVELLQWRLRMTGVSVQARRAASRRKQ